MHQDTVIGTITSGDWGHRTGMNLAYAYHRSSNSRFEGARNQLDLCGNRVDTEVIAHCPYDPGYSRVRA